MSGFLPDLASWALGGSRNNDEDNDENNNETEESISSSQPALSPDEIRARRLGRLMNNVQIESSTNAKDDESANVTTKPEDSIVADTTTTTTTVKKDEEFNDAEKDVQMEEELKPAASEKPPPSTSSSSSSLLDASKNTKDAPSSETAVKPAPSTGPPKKRYKEGPTKTAMTAGFKLMKKKELMLKKCMGIVLSNSNFMVKDDRSVVCIDVEFEQLESENLSQQISEMLVARLSMEPGSKALNTVPPQKPGIVGYCAHSHRVTADQIRLLQTNQSKSTDDDKEIVQLLVEIQKQVVSYAASSLMEPDLFPSGKDGSKQLAKCLQNATTDLATSITFGATGTKSSFYYVLCDELSSQDMSSFNSIIQSTVSHIIKSLERSDSILDSGDGGIVTISALKALCSHKKAAAALTLHSNFLLPPANSPQAKERISNLPPGATPQQQQIFQMMQALNRGITGYQKRSGPALEKHTILGQVLKLGLPMESASVVQPFQNAATKTVNHIQKVTDGMRRQLKMYQDESFALVKSLVGAGPQAKDRVMMWITDALLVNIGSTAMRPDRSKVSNSQTLLNIGSVLLKLCDPFVSDPKKSKLIDPGFVSSEAHHGNVFSMTGDDAVSRLSQRNQNTDESNSKSDNANSEEYNPKNTFIPQLFFFTARILHLGLIPSSGYHTSLARRVNHTAYTLRQRNADVVSDPDFNQILSMQYANEVSVLNPDLLTDALRFMNCCAGFLNSIDDEKLPSMPEHLVDDMCDLITFTSRMATKVMQGVDFGNVFKVTVKLLSPNYAQTIRNYNLRAKLGDVLYDVFLPSNANDANRSVPASVSCDPQAGGQPYLLSDESAQDTLAPSLLLLYGEVEHTGHYEQMSHRSHIASLLKYLWESKEHRPAFRRITQNKESFIKFANGIVNETNGLIASVMEKLPEIKRTQDQMKNPQQWASLTDEQRETIVSRHEENEQEVKRALPLCNKTMQMLGFLNTDSDIRNLFLLEEMCGRLVNLLMNFLTKLVGSRGIELKVDNPESYNFRPKEMLRDICSIFATFSSAEEFQVACAKSAFYKLDLLSKSVKTCRKHNLLTGDSMTQFETLADKVETAARNVEDDDALTADAPDEFLDPLTCTFMTDPVILPTSNTVINRASIAQHLLNDPHDPFNRKELTMEMVVPATELKEKMKEWLNEKKKSAKAASSSTTD